MADDAYVDIEHADGVIDRVYFKGKVIKFEPARGPYDTLATAIHDAADLASKAKAANVVIVACVPHGEEARDVVRITAYSEVCFALLARERQLDLAHAEIARLRARLSADSDDAPEFEPEIIEAGDR